MDFLGLCLKYENTSGAPIELTLRMILGDPVPGGANTFIVTLVLEDTSSAPSSTYAFVCIAALGSDPNVAQ